MIRRIQNSNNLKTSFTGIRLESPDPQVTKNIKEALLGYCGEYKMKFVSPAADKTLPRRHGFKWDADTPWPQIKKDYRTLSEPERRELLTAVVGRKTYPKKDVSALSPGERKIREAEELFGSVAGWKEELRSLLRDLRGNCYRKVHDACALLSIYQ